MIQSWMCTSGSASKPKDLPVSGLVLCVIRWKMSRAILYFSKRPLDMQIIPSHILSHENPGGKRRQLGQVRSSLLSCMLKASEQSGICRPSRLWKHRLSWGETVASCLGGSALVSDRFVFLKSPSLPELDFLSPIHAPPLRSGTLCFECELSLPLLLPF